MINLKTLCTGGDGAAVAAVSLGQAKTRLRAAAAGRGNQVRSTLEIRILCTCAAHPTS